MTSVAQGGTNGWWWRSAIRLWYENNEGRLYILTGGEDHTRSVLGV